MWLGFKDGPSGFEKVGGLEGSGSGSNTCVASTLSFLLLPPTASGFPQASLDTPSHTPSFFFLRERPPNPHIVGDIYQTKPILYPLNY